MALAQAVTVACSVVNSCPCDAALAMTIVIEVDFSQELEHCKSSIIITIIIIIVIIIIIRFQASSMGVLLEGGGVSQVFKLSILKIIFAKYTNWG